MFGIPDRQFAPECWHTAEFEPLDAEPEHKPDNQRDGGSDRLAQRAAARVDDGVIDRGSRRIC